MIRSLNVGGAERQLIALAGGLQKRGHKIVVATFYDEGSLAGDLDVKRVRRISLQKRGRWDVLPFLIRLYRLLKHERPDVVHSYLTEPNIVATLLLLAFPRMRLIWGIRASNVDFGQYDLFSRVAWKVACKLSQFATLIVANSQVGKDYHTRHGFPSERIYVIPNGINTEQFSPDPAARARVRSEWGIGNGDRLIGLVARLDPMKDHSCFLQAAAMLKEQEKGIRFVCVGDGPETYRLALERMALGLGLGDTLIWAGSRSDMTAVYNALDISSSSSFGEGFSNAIAEAMACGIPCVVTDAGDSALIVGNTGIVVPVQSPQALAEGWGVMLARLEAKTEKTGEMARRRIIEKFGLERMISATAEALEGLVR